MGNTNEVNNPFIKEKNINNSPKSFPISAFNILQEQSKKSICKILLTPKGTGTGFFCKMPFPSSFNLLPVLITTNHNLNEDDIAPGKEIKFSLNNKEKSILIDDSRKTYTDSCEKGDITIIEIKENDGLEIESFLDVDNSKNNYTPEDYKDNNIYIIHYPNGQNIESSIGLIKYSFQDDDEILHSCDTQYGSSGSPIINFENYKVLGVHKGYNELKKLNVGTLIKNYSKEFYKKIKEGSLKKGDEIKMKYKIGKEKKIRIFGTKFVENNVNNCKIIYKGNEEGLKSFFEIEDINNNEILEIKLIGIKNISNIEKIFCECFLLINIEGLEYLDTSKLLNMSGLFDGCSSLLSLPDISKWNTTNVTDMRLMYNHCDLLKSLPDISKWDISNVTSMGGIFQFCLHLSFLPNITNWDTSHVTDMSYMFSHCESLKSIPDISKWNTSNVTNMKALFQRCEAIISLPNISNWNTSSVNDMSHMFNFCTSLVSLPEISNWDVSNVTDMSFMFNRCSSLLSIPDISKWNFQNVKSILHMFSLCSSLKNLPDISKWNTKKDCDIRIFAFGADNNVMKGILNIIDIVRDKI